MSYLQSNFTVPRSAQDSCYIVVKREAHQQEQCEYAYLLAEYLRAIGHWAAFYHLHQLIHNLPAVDLNEKRLECKHS